MTQLASDTFNRADSVGLGANWTANSHDSGTGGFDIASNAAVPHSGSADSSSLYNAVSFPNDQYSDATFSTTFADGVGVGSGPTWRETSAAATYYRAVGNASGYEAGKWVAGTFTSLSSGSGTTFTAGDVLHGESQGTNWALKKNAGANFASGSDGSISSGSAGLGFSSAVASPSRAGIDAWAGGDFGGGASLVVNPLSGRGGTTAQPLVN